MLVAMNSIHGDKWCTRLPTARWLGLLLAVSAGCWQSDGQGSNEAVVTPPLVPSASYTETLRRDLPGVLETVTTPWVQDVLRAAQHLPARAPRVVWRNKDKGLAYSERERSGLSAEQQRLLTREVLDDTAYYAKYSSPLAYARLLELMAQQAGVTGLNGKKIVDFGYGDIGQLQLFSRAGAQVLGVDLHPLLPVLYAEPSDRAFPPGTLSLVHGRWPVEAHIRTQVGTGVELFVSKNTLKRGYIRPQPLPHQKLNPKQLLDLGVPIPTFLERLRDALSPEGLVVIYNICPAPSPSQAMEYVAWADGHSPFTREEWESHGFELLAFDSEDTDAVRILAKALHWDEGDDKMDVETGLFAWYTMARRVLP